MGKGKVTKWTGLICPFFDRPDITVPVLWYPAAQPYVPGPPTVFTDRFYDAREHWTNVGLPGTVPGSLKPYFGPAPASVLGPQVGSDADFANGISYDAYLASGGSPATPCAVVQQQLGRRRGAQAQRPARADWVGAGSLKVYSCPQCPQGQPTVSLLRVSGVTDGSQSAANLNGTFTLTFQIGCQWESSVFTLPSGKTAFWRVTIQVSGTRVQLNQQTPVVLVYALADDPGVLACTTPASWSGGSFTATADFTWTAASLLYTPANE